MTPNPILIASVFLLAAASAGAQTLRLTVQGGAHTLEAVPMEAAVELPRDLSHLDPDRIAVRLQGPADVPGQVVGGPDGRPRLVWVAPVLPAGQTQSWTVFFSELKEWPDESGFRFYDEPGEHLDLFQGNRRVTRYQYGRDTSTPERARETFKTFHHVFDPTGQHLLTNGPSGLYPHHRGLFIGWHRMQYEGRRYDLWHMPRGEAQVHQRFVELTAGPVLARATDNLHWLTDESASGVVLLEEKRAVTLYRQPEPALLLMDFVTTLTAPSGDVLVEGDSEHAGFHFRASNLLSGRALDGSTPAPIPADARQASFLLPDDELTAFSREMVEDHPGMPWAAMNFRLGGREYTVLHLNHPENPDNTQYSAYRAYGRFGAYPRFELKRGESAVLKYRIIILNQPMPTREEIDARWTAYAHPPQVEE